MRALVVYESMYGNTAAIAAEIAAGLDDAGIEVALRNVDDAASDDLDGTDLVVVGGPTHAHGMTRAATRRTALADAENTYADPTGDEGLRAWLGSLGPVEGRRAAAFDTRIDIPAFLSGAASRGITRGLEGAGFDPKGRESLLVTKENALVDGETARARAWGRGLGVELGEGSEGRDGTER